MDVLRKEWGFNGFILSDLGAIRMIIDTHKTAKDTIDAVVQAIKAGLNMQFYDFEHESFRQAIENALAHKMLKEEELNRAVKDILRVKFMLGLFEHPYVDVTLRSKVFHTNESQELALQAAQQGIVLLKNDHALLPLKKEQTYIAIVGELAESTYPGGYSNPNKEGISILEGLKQRAGTSRTINYEKGYTSSKNQGDLKQRAVNLVKQSDVAVVVIGENGNVVGEGKDRSDINLDMNQLNLVKEIYATGKPIVAVLFNGRPLTINWVTENIPAIIETWFSGEKGGLAIADVLLGNVNPSGNYRLLFLDRWGKYRLL